MYTWNEFLLALVLLAGPTTRPRLSASPSSPAPPVRQIRPRSLRHPCSSPHPIVIVYLFLQRHFIRGVLAGALKE